MFVLHAGHRIALATIALMATQRALQCAGEAAAWVKRSRDWLRLAGPQGKLGLACHSDALDLHPAALVQAVQHRCVGGGRRTSRHIHCLLQRQDVEVGKGAACREEGRA